MCGITALLIKQNNYKQSPSLNPCASLLKESLIQLQHRGYDGAGIALDSPDKIILGKGKGLIKDVLNQKFIEKLSRLNKSSNYGLGHTRYKTKGECTNGSSQPLINESKNLCLVHNGQVESKECLPDTIYILNLIESLLKEKKGEITTNEVLEIIQNLFYTLRGSYSCVLMIHNFGLVVFRDLYGIRPLVYASSSQAQGIASEDIALSKISVFGNNRETTYRDVRPGECLILRPNYPPISYQCKKGIRKLHPCIFEYIYLAHPDSTFNSINVMKARKLLGRILAQKIQMYLHTDDLPDYIIPVPETSCPATHEIAKFLNIPYLEALSLKKDRAKARTFILPTQEERVKAVSEKFEIPNPVTISKLKNKHVMIVDDSIVRGTTLQYIVKLFKEKCQAKEITIASISPPIKHKNIYGIDIPDSSILIASRFKTYKEIAKELGADQIIYQDLKPMIKNFQILNKDIGNFETSLFDGLYVI